MSDALTFTPSEAAALSGVSTELQRNWRHRKLLPDRAGARAVFSLEDVAGLYLINAASVLGPIADVRDGCAVLAKELARYASDLAAGKTNHPPLGAGAMMPNGKLVVFLTVQEAVDALKAEESATHRLLIMDAIATPFAIRVRDHLKART